MYRRTAQSILLSPASSLLYHLEFRFQTLYLLPEFQFSLVGGIGANYRLADHLGVFVEPGVSYFFDDGGDVRTIRKKTPFNFQVQGGIRMMW